MQRTGTVYRYSVQVQSTNSVYKYSVQVQYARTGVQRRGADSVDVQCSVAQVQCTATVPCTGTVKRLQDFFHPNLSLREKLKGKENFVGFYLSATKIFRKREKNENTYPWKGPLRLLCTHLSFSLVNSRALVKRLFSSRFSLQKQQEQSIEHLLYLILSGSRTDWRISRDFEHGHIHAFTHRYIRLCYHWGVHLCAVCFLLPGSRGFARALRRRGRETRDVHLSRAPPAPGTPSHPTGIDHVSSLTATESRDFQRFVCYAASRKCIRIYVCRNGE